ncbi:hypothetical protein M6D93_10205 [Jatrophihabitans telluris]|uniref:Uncharacterized protein n=1 Tax=Jatrophihabitans telluris TaxID=2038343 RepID=A0ABY4QTL8_9ACTN|nr:hypothetical protein [Jatrophihabitans telluris]UQX86684.1 hypothetical protein M6D93_10205 [Jatrophihabitans telluris]
MPSTPGPSDLPEESPANADARANVSAGNDAQRRSEELRARLRTPLPQVSSRAEIVYLDPRRDRPVSQYSPEGEIRMMGEFAAGLSRHRSVSRPMAYGLVIIVLLPILLSALALILGML